jgi:hypothetical protein
MDIGLFLKELRLLGCSIDSHGPYVTHRGVLTYIRYDGSDHWIIGRKRGYKWFVESCKLGAFHSEREMTHFDEQEDAEDFLLKQIGFREK